MARKWALAGRERLEAVRAIDEPDASMEEALDRVTRLAQLILDAPVVLLTLVEDDRQVFLSQQGLAEPWRTRRETPLSHSFCQHVVVHRRPLAIEDARERRLTQDSLAIRDLGAVAYLGVPLEDPAGHVLGALCIIDHEPRSWDPRAVQVLEELAGLAMDEIVLRGKLRRQTQVEASIRDAEERFRALAADLSHRVNNAVAIIGSVVRHSLRTADSLPQAARSIEGRIQALVRTHDLMNRDAWVQTRLLGVIKAVLVQFGSERRSIQLQGEDVALPSRLALLFALTVHELASNAIRHGALLSPAGRVRVRWKLRSRRDDGARQILFLWLEEGGPAVQRPRRLGFGTTLIRRLAQAQDVKVRIDYRPEGVRCLLQAPMSERARAAS